jgi:hypothetical protein
MKYTNEEFKLLSSQLMKEAIESKLISMEIIAFDEDDGIIHLSTNTEFPIHLYSTDNHTMFTEYWEEFKQLMFQRGFTVESLPIQGSMYINDYTYINETLKAPVTRILSNREELENIPRIDYKELDILQEYIGENAVDREHALKLLKEKLKQ